MRNWCASWSSLSHAMNTAGQYRMEGSPVAGCTWRATGPQDPITIPSILVSNVKSIRNHGDLICATTTSASAIVNGTRNLSGVTVKPGSSLRTIAGLRSFFSQSSN
eukprot:4362194-Pyramimonas_sp.AAC.1